LPPGLIDLVLPFTDLLRVLGRGDIRGSGTLRMGLSVLEGERKLWPPRACPFRKKRKDIAYVGVSWLK
jgi:hypothetical protein